MIERLRSQPASLSWAQIVSPQLQLNFMLFSFFLFASSSPSSSCLMLFSDVLCCLKKRVKMKSNSKRFNSKQTSLKSIFQCFDVEAAELRISSSPLPTGRRESVVERLTGAQLTNRLVLEGDEIAQRRPYLSPGMSGDCFASDKRDSNSLVRQWEIRILLFQFHFVFHSVFFSSIQTALAKLTTIVRNEKED